jgi:NAD-dependent deacetylase
MDLPEGAGSALHAAKKILVLTGAGMSAESGVPTFRDAQTGMWENLRPEDLATNEGFRNDPTLVWDWYEARRNNILSVSPHAGHYALCAMEQHFADFLIATQNVDSLHQQAGSQQVVELHGNIMLSICSETGIPIDDEWIKASTKRPPTSPHHVQGLARPGVVWFGESLPPEAMNRATAAAIDCDLCLSIGTSTLVQPAASLPFVALQSGATVIEINPVPTALSSKAHFSLQTTAAVALPALAATLT